ncbi:hypothetical protein [Thomasclavelia cocleata]|uniref:Transposase n=1 Tax=Thomasclavelia cocleata TaxID=69824 RepID=A0A829ZCA3_9FIRM|nr:hypothetical protein [Thomasclavelia cocleata]GFI41699.1 hypothetical protein IMSAGC017_01744 [Thomasclavelia cocleata]
MNKPAFTDEFKQGLLTMYSSTLMLPRSLLPNRLGWLTVLVHKWLKDAKNNNGTINSRGSGNYSSDKAKEIARLKKELKDTKDALDVLKKAIGILGN